MATMLKTCSQRFVDCSVGLKRMPPPTVQFSSYRNQSIWPQSLLRDCVIGNWYRFSPLIPYINFMTCFIKTIFCSLESAFSKKSISSLYVLFMSSRGRAPPAFLSNSLGKADCHHQRTGWRVKGHPRRHPHPLLIPVCNGPVTPSLIAKIMLCASCTMALFLSIWFFFTNNNQNFATNVLVGYRLNSPPCSLPSSEQITRYKCVMPILATEIFFNFSLVFLTEIISPLLPPPRHCAILLSESSRSVFF